MNRLLISASRRSSGFHVAHCAVRSKSSTASLINKCPITGGGGGGRSKTSSSSNATTTLYKVPKLPFLGSIIPQYSGTDKFDLSKTYDWWYGNHEKFGDFYSIGLPGMGKGLDGTTYVVTDANEYMKVLRKEGKHPFGAVMTEWPFIKYYEDGGDSPGCKAGRALFTQGDEWQKIRRFMQTDLLSPDAARGYVPGMIKACQIASQGAPSHANNINEYMAQCSFDMFTSIMFGEFTGLAGSGGDKDKHNEKFCTSSIAALELIVPIIINPVEKLQSSLGLKTKLYSTFRDNFDVV